MDIHFDHMPILSRGRHRNPRKGACFMEMASYLAGERWSDHPACTHPLLAGLARLVNDHTSDAHRGRLAAMVPSIIGLTGDDVRLDALLALRCATSALPVAAAERQLALAVSILAAEEVLNRLDGLPSGHQREQSRTAFTQAPQAAEDGRRFSRAARITLKGFRKYAAPNAVQLSVIGIAEACVPDPDSRLRELLRAAIDDCAGVLRAPAPQEAFSIAR